MSFKHFTSSIPLELNVRHLARLRKYCVNNGLTFDKDKLSEVYSFWIENICIPTHFERDHKVSNQMETINRVLLEDVPDLMFINTDTMKQRFDKFRKLGFINNIDKLYLFRQSPIGWYLQDWRNFSIKYHYIQYRIMPWLLEKEDDQYPEPHPLIRACRSLELPYDQIKSRFLWVSSAGVKPSKLNDKRGDQLLLWKVLHNLLLTEAGHFVQSTTPGLDKREYLFFEKMIEQTEMIEDSVLQGLSEAGEIEAKNILYNHEDEDLKQLAEFEFKRIE